MAEKPLSDIKTDNDNLWLKLNGVILLLCLYGSTLHYCQLYGLEPSLKEYCIIGAYNIGFVSMTLLLVLSLRLLAFKWLSQSTFRITSSLIFAFFFLILVINQFVLSLLGVTIDDPFVLDGLLGGTMLRDTGFSVHNYLFVLGSLLALFVGELLLCRFLGRQTRPSGSTGLMVVVLGLATPAFFLIPQHFSSALIYRALPFAHLMETQFDGFSGQSSRYLKELHFEQEKAPVRLRKKPHLVFILLESWRFDSLTQERMPQLTRLAQSERCKASKLHVSGSHVTNLGTFGLLFGMENYYFYTNVMDDQAWPLRILKENDYRTLGVVNSVIHSKYRRSFDQYHTYTKHKPYWEGDQKALDEIIKTLSQSESNDPLFAFAFMFSSHHNYYYPKEFEVHQPVSDEDYNHFAGDEKLIKQKDKIINRYKNSLLYLDDTIVRFMGKMEALAKERNEEVAFVITGDHGEEFWDTGMFLGHGADTMVDSRIRVPLVTCGIPIESEVLSHTSNAMVWPTIFDWLSDDEIKFVNHPANTTSFLRESPETTVSYAMRYPKNGSMFAVYHKYKKFTGQLYFNRKKATLLKVNDAVRKEIVPQEQFFWTKYSNALIKHLMSLEKMTQQEQGNH